MAKVKFLYDELGEIDSSANPASRQKQLVEVITGRKNGRLPRTIVNRIWQRFLGYGLVEPVDEMDKPAWSSELLDFLAEDLVAHGYDLKHTMARILTSRAYQLPSVNVGENEENYVFRGPAVRRLSAEQFSDAILGLTRKTYEKVDGRLNRLAALQPAADTLPLQPKWIWSTADANRAAKPATLLFRRIVTLPAVPTEARFAISADDNYTIKINGKAAGLSSRRNATYADSINIKAFLKAGENTIDITVANMPPDEGRLVSVKKDALPDSDSPAGLLLYAFVRSGEQVLDFVSDRSWTVLRYTEAPATRGAAVTGVPTKVGPAVEMGDLDLPPWKFGRHFLDVAAAPRDTLPVERASLVSADPLMNALGRPNREQVMTARQTTATTLQALELTNGATLARLLKQGADKILADEAADSSGLIDSLYQKTVSRPPAPAERELAQQIVGSPAKAAGIEDLLWILAMLPEFQLIR